MRDERGFYRDTKPLEELVPEWAKGCGKCKCGIVQAPPLTGAAPLNMERLIQVMDGDITFCDCQAGSRYYNYLRNRYRILIEEAKKLAPTDLRMADAAMRKTHPEIEIARHHIEQSYMDTEPPTIRFEGEPVTA
jgi:hypothetical protein